MLSTCPSKAHHETLKRCRRDDAVDQEHQEGETRNVEGDSESVRP